MSLASIRRLLGGWWAYDLRLLPLSNISLEVSRLVSSDSCLGLMIFDSCLYPLLLANPGGDEEACLLILEGKRKWRVFDDLVGRDSFFL